MYRITLYIFDDRYYNWKHLRGLIVKYFLLLTCCLLLVACQTNMVKAPAEVDDKLTYPQQTDTLVLMGKKTFDDPLDGVQLRYQYIFYPDDVVDIYIYPIARTNWANTEEVLKEEYDNVLKQVDYAIEQGHYASRGEQQSDWVSFDEKRGLKGQFKLVFPPEDNRQSYVYLFIQEDKFLKFRLSLVAEEGAKLPNTDEIVEDLLGGISVPPESEYMAKLRKQQREKVQTMLLQMIIESMQKNEEEQAEQNWWKATKGRWAGYTLSSFGINCY